MHASLDQNPGSRFSAAISKLVGVLDSDEGDQASGLTGISVPGSM
jgi:hypothetical protein